MYRQVSQVILVLSIVLLLGTVTVVAVARAATPGPAETTGFQAARTNEGLANRIAASTAYTYTTVIIVDSTVDTPGDGSYVDCTWTPCNLRRALVDARSRPPAERPVLIGFNIPIVDTNYALDGVAGTWTIVMEADYTYGLDTSTILEPESRIIIDGDTQPIGRTGGPRIIINSGYSLEALKEDNVIRALAFNGGGGVYLNESSNVGGGNLVENVWVGLHANGQEIVPGDNPNVTLAGSGVIIASDNNVISDSIITGPHIGISLQGDNNLIQSNYIGTQSDTTVPTDTFTCVASSVYNPAQWYGGGGIKFLNGSNNQVISNTIAAVHLPHSPTETYPPAIETAGSSNLFAYNTIGIDGTGVEVGTCGQGFHVTGHDMRLWYNTIVNSRYSYTDGDTGDPTEGAIFINDSSPLARKYTVRNNIVRDSTAKVIEYGPSIPASLRLFDPPRIVSIDGTLVVGETEVGSDCPNCLVELYLDDLGDGQDALELLKTAVIDNVAGTARFTATLDSPLPANHGIRVLATTQDDYVIDDYLSGTTVMMSPAYAPDATFTRDLAPGWNLFSIDVTPPSAAIADVLGSLTGQYDVVLSFDGGPSGGGSTYDPNNPGASDLTTIDVTHGYWINITATTTQTLVLDYEPARDDTSIVLYDGWNLVSFLPDRTMAITAALSSIAGTYDLVQGFDGAGQTYMPGQPQFSDLTELQPGHAYWIKITESTGSVTLNYAGYDALRTSLETDTSAPDTRQGVAVPDFFSPTTEWVDFYGVASLSGFSAPHNASVVAYDPDGVVAGAFTVHTPPYYGFLHVYADDARTPEDEGAESGDEIRFTINGRLATASKTTTWTSRGDATEVNLEVTMPYVTTDEWSDFWGTLTLDGKPAPVGTILAAYDPSGVYIGDYILTEAGQYGFLHAYGDDATTTADEGAETGNVLSFKAFLPLSSTPIDVTPDSGSATWQGRGSRAEINLSGSNLGGSEGAFMIYLPVVLK